MQVNDVPLSDSEWRWVDVTLPEAVEPMARDAAAQANFDRSALELLRSGDKAAASSLRGISLGFASDQRVLEARIFWTLSAAFFEAIAFGLCVWDLQGKRMLAQVLLQDRKLARGETAIAVSLARDLLSLCATAMSSAPAEAVLLGAVGVAYRGKQASEPSPNDLSAPLPEEQVRVIGSLRVALPQYNRYLNQTDEWSRCLITELSEWALELHRPVADSTIELAQSLAHASADVGFLALADMATALEQALRHVGQQGHGRAAQARVFLDTAEVMRRLLHQFAAGFLRPADEALLAALAAMLQPPIAPVPAPEPDADLAAQRLAQFAGEAPVMLGQLGGALRQWTARPDNLGARSEVLRVLQLFEQSAQAAGASELGQKAQVMLEAVEALRLEALHSAGLSFLEAHLQALQEGLERQLSASVRR